MNINLDIPENILRAAIIEGVKEVLAPLLPQVSEKLNAILPTADPKEIATSGVRKILIEKGYRVKSPQSLKRLLEEHKVKGIKRGSEYWFPYQEVKRIALK